MEDRAFLKALETVVLTQFPNPERRNCPGTATLTAIAKKAISMRDPAIEHVGHCSPCFKELHEIRTRMRQTRALSAAAGSTAILVAAILVGLFSLHRPADNSAIDGAQRNPQNAEIDLREFSLVRGEPQPAATNTPRVPLLNRGLLNVQIKLPVGAEEGPYDVAIKINDDSPLTTVSGEAKIENYITTLRMTIDTSHIPKGDYRLAVRHPGFDWRYYPLTIR